ncbi:hypothetical protein ID866_959 [Astraeus odoratus]|nr:hypothetical protein ID866_959 [Astraeus odoratus]
MARSDLNLKFMYEDSRTVESWIEAVYYTIPKASDTDVSDANSIIPFSCHPFGNPSLPSSACEPCFDISACLGSSTWLSELHRASFDDSDGSGSSTSSGDDVQYINIPCDSPWYRPPPSPSPEPAPSPDLDLGTFPNSCSSDVRQAIAQQELLLSIFHAELRRIIPHDSQSDYDPDWLEDVDPEVVLSPTEVYEELCWHSAVSDQYVTCRLTRPLADVPIGFGDVHVTF